MDDLKPERDECFEIELSNPDGGAKLGKISKMAVTISNDDGELGLCIKIYMLSAYNIES